MKKIHVVIICIIKVVSLLKKKKSLPIAHPRYDNLLYFFFMKTESTPLKYELKLRYFLSSPFRI